MRNDTITKSLNVENITAKCRKAKLMSFGHMKRRYQEYVGRNTLEMVPPGRRTRGRPKKRCMDCGNGDMGAIETIKDKVNDLTSLMSARQTHN